MNEIVKTMTVEEAFNKLIDILLEYWKTLKEEFNDKNISNVPLVIARHDQFLEVFYEAVKKHHPRLRMTKGFLKHVKGFISAENYMTTQHLGFFESGESFQFVYVADEVLIEALLVAGPGGFDHVVDKSKMSLRHEMGHCISNNAFYEKAGCDACKAQDMYSEANKRNKEGLDLLNLEYENTPHDVMYLKKYFNLPLEYAADTAVGLTCDDHIKLHYKDAKFKKMKRF